MQRVASMAVAATPMPTRPATSRCTCGSVPSAASHWPRASALAILMIVLVVMPLSWYNLRVSRQAQREMTP